MILQSHLDYEDSIDLPSVSDIEFRLKSRKHREFIKQPLKLGMFIPCDENDVPLKQPDDYNWCARDYIGMSNGSYPESIQYQQAKERVLFEGLELVEIYKYGAMLEMKFDDFSEKITILFEDTVEDLLTYSFDPEFKLTDSAIKQIKL